MASLKKKTSTRKLPAGATITSRRRRATKAELKRNPSKGTVTEQIATWRDRKGDKRHGVVTKSADGTLRVRVRSEYWHAKYRDGEGIIREVPTGCRDKEAAKSKLAELVRQAELVRAGVMTSDQAEIAEHQKVPLSVHLAEYIEHLRCRSVHPDRVKTTETRLTDSAESCGFRWLSDLNVDRLEKWLLSLKEKPKEPTNDQPKDDITSPRPVSASVYNGYVEVWVAFGFWCAGKRIAGKRSHLNGDKRLLINPFEGMGRKDTKQDRRRTARALTEDELLRLLDAARRRPLIDAMTIRSGPNKGQLLAKVSERRKPKLERLGQERALIYKTYVLTGMRADELRTLTVNRLSFGEVPFVTLRHSDEKNRQGSSLPLRSDLASELKAWVQGRAGDERVFNVPMGILRIMDKDLKFAGIPKKADGCVIHIHGLRHSFGTHLSLAGVAPRVAQKAMRHSDISLTMNTYTDSNLLDTAAAVESLPILSGNQPSAAPMVAPETENLGQPVSFTDHSGEGNDTASPNEKARETLGFTGFDAVGATRFELATSTSRI